MKLSLLSVVVVIFGFGASGAQAGLNNSELRSLADRLAEISVHDEPNCTEPSSETSTPLFLFEGAIAYCPRFAFMNLGRDADGKTLAQRFAETEQTYENRPWMAKVRKLVGQEIDSKSCTLVRNVVRLESTMDPSLLARRDVRYYSRTGHSEAVECAKRIYRSDRPIRAIGYSMGGYALEEFTKRVGSDRIPIEEAVSIDPVGRNLLWITGVFFTLDNPYFRVPENVLRWRNYFERFDRRSIIDEPYFKLGARGSRVVGAEINQEIFPKDLHTDWEVAHPHIAIHLSAPVSDAVVDLFRR